MRILECEHEAREHSFIPNNPNNIRTEPSSDVTCVYCGQSLKKHHLSLDCWLTYNCKKCHGRHHASVCHCCGPQQGAKVQCHNPNCRPAVQLPQIQPMLRDQSMHYMWVPKHRSYLRWPNYSYISNLDSKESAVFRPSWRVAASGPTSPIILIYRLRLPTSRTESSKHLAQQRVTANASEILEVDVVIGSDSYRNPMTGRVIWGAGGLISIRTKVTWVLSGLSNTDQRDIMVNFMLTFTHTLKVDVLEPTLDDQLKCFWDLESLGVMKNKTSVYDKYMQQIRFDGQRYEVSLPWKEYHPPDHYPIPEELIVTTAHQPLEKASKLHSSLNYSWPTQRRDDWNCWSNITCSQRSSPLVLPAPATMLWSSETRLLQDFGLFIYDASARSTGPSPNNCL